MRATVQTDAQCYCFYFDDFPDFMGDIYKCGCGCGLYRMDGRFDSNLGKSYRVTILKRDDVRFMYE